MEFAEASGSPEYLEKAIDRRHQIAGAEFHDPLHGPTLRQGKAHFHIRIQVMREGIFPRIDQGVVRLPRVNVLERVGRGWGRFDPLQTWSHGPLHFLKEVLLRAVRPHGHFRRFKLQRASRPRGVVAVNHELLDPAVGHGCVTDAFPFPVRRDLCRGDVGLSVGQRVLHRFLVCHGVDQ